MKKAIPTLFLALLLLVSLNSNSQKSKLESKSNQKAEYLEIPARFIGEPILFINRITGYPNKFYHYGSSGMDVDYSIMLTIENHNDEYLKIIEMQYQNKVPDTDIIKTSVKKNHFDPVAIYVPIVSSTKESVTIEAELFKKDIKLFSPVSNKRIEKYQLQANASKPIAVSSLRVNKNDIQVSRTLNYTAKKLPEGHYSDYISVEQLITLRILPSDLMTPRKWDPRVGNFYLSNKKYSSESYFIKEEMFLERWRLEPTDTAAYFRGELTAPEQPIVFYMDENVPHKWRKYIKQGVLDWLPVFEAIGFKNAIEVHDKPKNATWGDSDPNYNMIRWVSSEIVDAQGNYVSDPRTGEILNGTLTWYQNLFSSINDEYFICAAAVDPSARTPILPDTLFGKIMRETMAHEMGHALGLGHNMIASSAYPTDSLRSRNFLGNYSLSPSIMDYASYNYVAQPEDMPLPLLRKIAPYDYWAIEYAYKYVRPTADNSRIEVAFTNEMINQKLQNPHLEYMEQEWPEVVDPTNVTGDLGDNPFLTGEYALKNLKRIMPHIVEWSLPDNGDPSILLSRYKKLISQLNVIFKNAIVYIGGEKNRFNNSEFILKTTDSDRALEAMNFLLDHLFTDMKWLYNSKLEEISNKKMYQSSLEKLQTNSIRMLLNKNRLLRLIDYDVENNTSTITTILQELSNKILKGNDAEIIPLNVQAYYVRKIKERIQDTADNLILNRMLKDELSYVTEIIEYKSQNESSHLTKCFYTELLGR